MRILFTRIFLFLSACLIFLSTTHWNPNILGDAVFHFSALLRIAAAVAGRMWCSLYIAGYKNAKLVQWGPYSLCRNPLYFSSLLGAVGIAINTQTFTIPVLVVVAFAVYYPVVIKKEEAVLLKLHGEAFEEYRRTVPAFFPKLSGFQHPEAYKVKPRVFLNHLASTLWFIPALGVVELLTTAHRSGVLPALIRLY